jgi:cell division protein FtsQ
MFFKKKIFILLLLIFFAGTFYIYTNNTKIYFPIKIISHTEIKNANKENILEYSKKYLSNKSFFNFNIDVLKKELEKFEWINSISVRRVWPSEVKLTIEEHEPLAIWNNKSYVNSNGKIFFVKEINKNLPRLNSENNRSEALFRYFSFFSHGLLKNKINEKIIEISENDIRSLSFLLSSGISVRFGSKNINDKMRIFFKSYKKILNTSDLKKIRYIDMRYSNGFSIGWK